MPPWIILGNWTIYELFHRIRTTHPFYFASVKLMGNSEIDLDERVPDLKVTFIHDESALVRLPPHLLRLSALW
jgi:hypothetical protein